MDTNIKYLIDNGINIWNKDALNYFKKLNPKVLPEMDENRFKNKIKAGSSVCTGDLGRVYGAQWRNFKGFKGYENAPLYDFGVDQISNLIKGLKENPMGTRHIVTAWNPAELDEMALPPCHWSFEILVEPINRDIISLKSEKDKYDVLKYVNYPKYQFTLKWHQRSVDSFLGR